jgi:hypothetical protein
MRIGAEAEHREHNLFFESAERRLTRLLFL